MDAQEVDQASFFVDDSKAKNPQQNPTCDAAAQSANCNLEQYHFSAILPTCKIASDINCIEGVGAIDSTGKKIDGVYARNYPNKAQNEFSGNPELKIPSGTTGSFFTIPGVKHSGGDNFYVSVLMKGDGLYGSEANITSFQAKITPVATVPFGTQTCGTVATCPDAGYANADPHSNGRWGIQGVGNDGIHNCMAYSTSEHTCAQRFGFPAGYSFYLKLRLTAMPSGWLHGRLTNPEINISKVGDYTSLQLSGAPVSVPVVYKGYMYADMPQALKDAYDPKTGNFKKGASGGGFSRICCENYEDPYQRNLLVAPSPSGAKGIEELKT